MSDLRYSQRSEASISLFLRSGKFFLVEARQTIDARDNQVIIRFRPKYRADLHKCKTHKEVKEAMTEWIVLFLSVQAAIF